MNRRRALQIFAATSFGSVLASQSAASAVANLEDNFRQDDLQYLLKKVTTAAADCERCTTSGISTHESRMAIRDAKFFADQAQQRLIYPDGKTPAFWQTCVSRLDAAMCSVESMNTQEPCFQRLQLAVSECLPSLNQHLAVALG